MYNVNFKNDGRLLSFEGGVPYRASRCVCCGKLAYNVSKVSIPTQKNGVWVHMDELSKIWNDKIDEVGSNSNRCINHIIKFVVPMDEDLAEVVCYARANGCSIKAYSPTHRIIETPLFTSNQASTKIFNGLACRCLKVFINDKEVKSFTEYKKLTDRLA